MTTLLPAPFPGADRFNPNDIDSTTYPTYTHYDSSVSYPDNLKDRASYINSTYGSSYTISTSSSAPPSPQLTQSSLSRGPSSISTSASSVSLSNREYLKEDQDDDMIFPSYEVSSSHSGSHYIPQPEPIEEEVVQPANNLPEFPGSQQKVNDDQTLQPEPTRHVDYLSHDWREEDIWASWRYVVHRRKDISNSRRLENASWRSWMKSKNDLKTVSPESLNWLKDCDVTWLYGPLQTGPANLITAATPPPSRLSRSPSFLAKKPILKKKSASAVILERSRSQHSLLQRVGDIIRIQQSSPALGGRPQFRRNTSDFSLAAYTGTSVANTPAETDPSPYTGTRSSFAFPDSQTLVDCKHVNFNDEVRQVQAVESDDDDKPPIDESAFDTDEDDDGGLMMAPSRTLGSRNGTPRGSFGNDSKTIMPLPSTTLKYRTDTPEPQVEQPGLWPRGKLSASLSQETLRPSRPNHNFLIDDDPELSDEPWQPSSSDGASSPYASDPGPNLRRTESGMFMPYDENEEHNAIANGLVGSTMYAIHTVKDIAHVIWNVGWHRDKTK